MPKELITIKPKIKLDKRQLALYELVCNKLAKDKSIEYTEVKNIYLATACRNIFNGKPCYYEYYKTKVYLPNGDYKWEGGWSEMNNDMLKRYVSCWLVRGIGILVMKGLLKVIPQIELSDIENECFLTS